MNLMLEQKLSQFIENNYLDGNASILTANTQLFSLNIIDSASIFELIDFLKQETGLAIEMKYITPANFASISAMIDFIHRLKSDSEGATK